MREQADVYKRKVEKEEGSVLLSLVVVVDTPTTSVQSVSDNSDE